MKRVLTDKNSILKRSSPLFGQTKRLIDKGKTIQDKHAREQENDLFLEFFHERHGSKKKAAFKRWKEFVRTHAVKV